MANEEERLLENQLELQLQEQRESLDAITQALSSDPSNPELLSVHCFFFFPPFPFLVIDYLYLTLQFCSCQVRDELAQVIKDAEEGLFQLKRARLLREADSVFQLPKAEEDVKAEPLDPNDVEAEPLEQQEFCAGSKCRFRYSDGRWYHGRILSLDGSDSAKISFLTPTSENKMVRLI